MVQGGYVRTTEVYSQGMLRSLLMLSVSATLGDLARVAKVLKIFFSLPSVSFEDRRNRDSVPRFGSHDDCWCLQPLGR